MSEPNENTVLSQEPAQVPDPLEESLAVYPLRKASEDPGWAVKTVCIWVGVAIFLLLFFLVLLVLGLWYD